ncbi:O-antigen ligase family protein [Bacteroides faecium]|uniref:O-antigen ligase family protein n=1 Tax=Bacteroides faecium TaxID=2715212 RepID=A0A6H0KQE9_9BACE|nr:O-antigen ligase family protein [Bacteroides faecium]QIU95515.1 O-antigen ligase family protein [Bacteroides faecium]
MNKFLAVLLLAIMTLSQISLLPFSVLHYVVLGICVLYTLSCFGNFNRMTMMFILVGLLSIMMNDIPVFFKAGQRFLLWTALMIGCSALVGTWKAIRFRRVLLLNVCTVAVIMTMLSFLSYVGGFGVWTGGVGFWGVAFHGNILGLLGMLSTIFLTHLLLQKGLKRTERRKYNKKLSLILIVGLGASFIILLLASSRSALLCTAVGVLAYLKFYFGKKQGKYISVLMVCVVALVLAYPFLGEYTEGIENKMAYGVEKGSFTASRTALWATRIEEFKRNPILGVGSFAVDTTIYNSDKYFNPYDAVTGVVELGSSYLGVLSQNGLLGFLVFILLLWKGAKMGLRKVKSTGDPIDFLFFSLFIMILFHMNFEGYVNTSGQILTLILWLVIACNIDRTLPNDRTRTIKGLIYY